MVIPISRLVIYILNEVIAIACWYYHRYSNNVVRVPWRGIGIRKRGAFFIIISAYTLREWLSGMANLLQIFTTNIIIDSYFYSILVLEIKTHFPLTRRHNSNWIWMPGEFCDRHEKTNEVGRIIILLLHIEFHRHWQCDFCLFFSSHVHVLLIIMGMLCTRAEHFHLFVDDLSEIIYYIEILNRILHDKYENIYTWSNRCDQCNCEFNDSPFDMKKGIADVGFTLYICCRQAYMGISASQDLWYSR